MNLINRYSFTCDPKNVDLQRVSLENPGKILTVDDTEENTLLFLPLEFLRNFRAEDRVSFTTPGLRGVTVYDELGHFPTGYYVRRRGLYGWVIQRNYTFTAKDTVSLHRCLHFPTDAKTEVFKDIADMEAFAKAKVSVAVSVYK